MEELGVVEKRKYKRLGFRGNALIKTRDGNARLLKASVDDLSWEGLRLRLPQRLDVNGDLELELMTKFLERPLMGRGIIRHVNESRNPLSTSFSAGVEFVNVDRKGLKEVIRQNLKRRDKSHFREVRLARDISLIIKLAPLLVLFSWLAVKAITVINLGMSESQQYEKKLREAAIYYLYHS